jgi:hypothetical protein
MRRPALRHGIEDSERTELFVIQTIAYGLHNLKQATAANTKWFCNAYIG